MSTHIHAKAGAIAETVLLPGDPLRAKYLAKTFLKDPVKFNGVRGMAGYTGTTPDGHYISVQPLSRISTHASGMGMPSLSIYVRELIVDYGVKKIIRVGTCGGFREDMHVRDIVLAAGACTDSGMNTKRFRGMHFAPIADWDLLHKAYHAAEQFSIPVRVGNILATDFFYDDEYPEDWKLWAKYGVLAVEMESAELYTRAALHGIQALSVLMVSDVIPTGESLGPEDRKNISKELVQIAFSI